MTEEQQKEFLLNIKQETPIYKIIRYDYLLEMLNTNSLKLVSPSKWDDPYENIYLKSTKNLIMLNDDNVVTEVKTINSKAAVDSIYGQCWSLKPETDALWRIYSNKENIGVKIKTTVGKLFKEIYNNSSKNKYKGSPYLGKVMYIQENNIKEIIEELTRKTTNTLHGLNLYPLLIKRKEFSHENELRLLFQVFMSDIFKEPKDVFKYNGNLPEIIDVKINAESLIEEIVIDPRTPIEEFQKMKIEIQSIIPMKVIKSKLYDVPNLKFEHVCKYSKDGKNIELIH